MLSTDEEAQFWSFYRKTSEALFRKAYRMCRGHQADADDVHQRTYLKALEHWPTVSGLADQQRNAWLATTLGERGRCRSGVLRTGPGRLDRMTMPGGIRARRSVW